MLFGTESQWISDWSSRIFYTPNLQTQSVLLTEELGLLRRDRPQVTKIALVADEHNDNVAIGVVTQLLEPAEDVDVGGMLGNVVDEESAHGAAVVAVEMGRSADASV